MPLFSFDPSSVPPGPSYDALPDIPAIRLLKSKRQWVAWKYELLPNGRWTKPPLSPHTGFKASSTNPQTWGTYQQAADRARRSNLAGIGFALLANGGFVGGDLDHCRNSETGEIEAWAAAIVAIAETYFHKQRRGAPEHLGKVIIDLEVQAILIPMLIQCQLLAGRKTALPADKTADSLRKGLIGNGHH